MITGNLELLETRVDGDNARALLKEAQDAAALGSQLTEQLLTFARQRQLDPHVVSLNELIIGVADMLRRTLGEQTSLSMTRTGAMARRWSVRFAVGTFNTWDGGCEALRDLRVAGADPETLSFLGLHRTMAGASKHSLELRLRELTRTTAGEPVCSTAGLLADRLAERAISSPDGIRRRRFYGFPLIGFRGSFALKGREAAHHLLIAELAEIEVVEADCIEGLRCCETDELIDLSA